MRILRLPTANLAARMSTSNSNSQAQANGAYTAEEYQRNPDHVAKTSRGKDESSYILTLHTDVAHHKEMTALRNQHFPKHINKLEAHIALFRALPGSELERIEFDIAKLAFNHERFQINTSQPFRLGKGVGIGVNPGPAKGIYEELRSKWEPFLSKQDLSFKAHYTMQNKVEDQKAVDETLDKLQKEFKGSKGVVEGLMLYRYDKGYWRREKEFMFAGGSGSEKRP